MPSPAEIDPLIALYNARRYAELENRARQLVEQHPDFGFGWKLLGGTLQMQDKNALPAFQKVAKLMPDDAEAHYNLGVALKSIGLLVDAAASYRKALLFKPNYAEAHCNLGNVLKDLGQLDEAVANYRLAIKIRPSFTLAHNNLGTALQILGQHDAALASYFWAVEIEPDFVEAQNNLSNALFKTGRLGEAESWAHKLIERYPESGFAWKLLGVILHSLGKDALPALKKATKLLPNDADTHYNLGITLKSLDQLDGAVASYRRALELRPDFADAFNNLGHAMHGLGHYGDAMLAYRQALKLNPDFAGAHFNLGNVLRCLGQFDKALASYHRALELNPNNSEGHSSQLFLNAYHALINSDDYLVQARNWERSCAPAQDRLEARHRVFQRAPLAGRRLRVGYVSGDYWQHPVSYFIEQLFAHHDRTRIELFAYSTHVKRDAVTERLQALAEHWVPLSGITDAAARERIEADGIDVLIDLSGHTAHNRLGVFSRRAAPVQAHYLGFFASTGLTEMDYWIGDEILTPAGADSHFSERVWRLPRVWVSYDGKADAPTPDWQPSQDGTIWLGSFNNLGKLTPATLALWAKVLHTLPGGKLLLKTKELADADNRRRILDAMVDHGISPDRIELQGSSATPDWSAHMAYYDRLDIALDPVGAVGGGTTTCDALWMGVPVITVEGDRMASRMTASMLDAIGHPEWIAKSEAKYIATVVALARDVEQREALRFAQRDKMASSSLCDSKDLTKSLESAYYKMFGLYLEEKN